MLLRFSLTVWVLAALASLVASQAYPITGVQVAAGSAVPYRKNINILYKNGGAPWDLYLRSLQDLYAQDANNRLSYFQIAGIHGRPYIEWNNAGRRNTNGWQGYCPHGEALFLPWHRPYVLAFEQRLVETAIRLANQYPAAHRATYVKAAQTLRAPFWDWGYDARVPPVTVPNTLPVRVPNGSGLRTIQISNPLRYYRFPQSAIDQRFGSFPRDAQVFKCRAPQNYPNSANAAMARRSYRSWTYDAMTRSASFEEFASTGSSGISLEQIHNAVHWDGSCGFQFLDADYSAFDPLFMLHHANVDRLWAYRQFMRPDQATLTRTYSGGARFSTPGGTSIGPNSPLQPFFAAPGRFHTPNSVRSIRGFGYTYEGLEYWKKNDGQLQRDATAFINKYYATGAARPQVRKRENVEVTRYFAQIKVNVEELQRPCAIELFANVTSVGNFIVMKQPAQGLFYGKFSLDKAADPVELADTETKVVVTDLLAALRVQITKHDGTVQALESVPSFKLELENVDVIPPETDTELPEYTDAEKVTAPKEDLAAAPPS
ncbi:hypothetical protein VD0002_g3029 [Verticillium dahliae]|nr:hypothetical protein VD0002_g3029 [Verticillium dahliae]